MSAQIAVARPKAPPAPPSSADEIGAQFYEALQQSVATNVYLKTTQGWRLVAHHASPGMPGAV